MINGKLEEFVGDVIARGQIRYGDVRRLQRDHLPAGIINREELELLIALNATLVQADKAWALWLVTAINEFVAEREVGKPPSKDAGEWVERLFSTATTRCGRRVAGQVRRKLAQRHRIQLTTSDKPGPESAASYRRVHHSQRRMSENNQGKPSQRLAKPACVVRRAAIQNAVCRTGPGWLLAGYLPGVQHSHFMNFSGARAQLALAPCR